MEAPQLGNLFSPHIFNVNCLFSTILVFWFQSLCSEDLGGQVVNAGLSMMIYNTLQQLSVIFLNGLHKKMSVK